MTLISYWAVLTEKGDQLTMEPGMGSTRDWFGVGTPSSHGSLPTQ